MLKKLTQKYTRTQTGAPPLREPGQETIPTANTQPLYYPVKERFVDEWNYIESKYGSLLTTVEQPVINNGFVDGDMGNSLTDLEFKWVKVGEEAVINEFIDEITSSNGRLHNRIVWCNQHNITYSFEITDV